MYLTAWAISKAQDQPVKIGKADLGFRCPLAQYAKTVDAIRDDSDQAAQTPSLIRVFLFAYSVSRLCSCLHTF